MPDCIHWSDGRGMYLALGHEHIHRAVWQNLRLDTFTRCQETTDVYVSLIGEMLDEIEGQIEYADPDCGDAICNDCLPYRKARDIVSRAKQILGEKK